MSVPDNWEFKFSLPEPTGGKVVELSPEEAELMLLNKLSAAKDDPKDALWQLARFYSQTKQHELALDYLHQVMDLQTDTDSKAASVLAMGQTMEQAGDYEAAVRYYREAFALEPVHTRTWYFINNNLGFSLNALGKFEEGEQFCRAAIKIDGQRPNAFKNLGIALQSRGEFAEAAQCFIQATQATRVTHARQNYWRSCWDSSQNWDWQQNSSVVRRPSAWRVNADESYSRSSSADSASN